MVACKQIFYLQFEIKTLKKNGGFKQV